MRVDELSKLFETKEIRFRLIRRRRVAKILKRILLPEAYLLTILAIFRPLGAIVFEWHEITFHTIFFVIFLPNLFLLTLALESDKLPRIIALIVLSATYGAYYFASFFDRPGYLYISVLSLGSLSAMYFVTFPIRAQIELLGFYSFRKRAPRQMFRYIRTWEILAFFALAMLFAIIGSLRLYLIGISLFFRLKRHFLKPEDVIRSLSFVWRNPKLDISPRIAIVLPAEPRAYILGVRNNLGLVSFLVFISAILASLRFPEGFASILLGASLSGLTALSAYALFYGLAKLNVYLVSLKVSGYERIIVTSV